MPTGKRELPGPLSVAVGAILSKARNDRGVAQVVVARAVGLSESQLSRALRGLKPLTLDQFEAVCLALDLDVVTVLSEADAAVKHRPVDKVVHLPSRANRGGRRPAAKPGIPESILQDRKDIAAMEEKYPGTATSESNPDQA